jgi:hypothetical protein
VLTIEGSLRVGVREPFSSATVTTTS